MNRTLYEGRYVVNMAGSVLKKTSLAPSNVRMDWERLYHIADYHKIANILYLALLGASERIPQQWGERFFDRYQESLQYSMSYENSELEILTLLNMHKVSAIVLESSATRRLYRIPETASNSPLRLLLNESNYSLAKGLLVDLGYLSDHIYTGFGEHMRGPSGFMVDLYYSLPFITKNYQKSMTSLMERAYVDKTFTSMHTFSLESSFVFRMAELCYNYCEDHLTVRKLLDVFLFYKQFRDKMNLTFVEARFRDFKIDEFAPCLIHIAAMWFGGKSDDMGLVIENLSVYDEIESRILSNGLIGHDSINQVLVIKEEIQRERDKEARAALRAARKQEREEFWAKVKQQFLWIFPEYKYMCSLYPRLETLPFLLPFYWIYRGIRMIRDMLHLSMPAKKKAEDSKPDYGSYGHGTGISYLPRETKTTQALNSMSAQQTSAAAEEMTAAPAEKEEQFDSIEAEEIQKNKLEEEIAASKEEEFTEIPRDSSEETSFGLWEFPKLSREEISAAKTVTSNANSDSPKTSTVSNNPSERTPVLIDERKKETAPSDTITTVVFPRINPERENEKTKDIVEAVNEQHEKVDVQRWHFPTLEEIENKN